MRNLALALIRFYQRHISPHKGFHCAYSAHTGCASCSALGHRAIRMHGVLNGLVILRKRMHLCGVAHRRHSEPPRRPLKWQRGDCDLGGCDVGACDGPGGCDSPGPRGKSAFRLLDCLSCGDCGSCDWPDRKRKNAREEKHIHIRPKKHARRPIEPGVDQVMQDNEREKELKSKDGEIAELRKQLALARSQEKS
jgi:putative component of membrane protein insertase Oxa1/YidC/SpoIIIJ protein YidD